MKQDATFIGSEDCPIPAEFFNSDKVFFNQKKEAIIIYLMNGSGNYTYAHASSMVEDAYQAKCDPGSEVTLEVGHYFSSQQLP
ncbi:hypothetical protein [Niabella hibiscisoli]|uniref:hypothetical protein n=1 Tax=Niabella hibiscisoli TaxID=1825928 RepID=UPI001F0E2E59|nr:hypothetical protein [Niabella hibiscisoli]MCH5715940.1 hypothetical protein [Niabella hibiscisoli]